MWEYRSTDELYHHGVLGQRWGFRRYQNADGTLTDAGKKKAAKLRNKYEKVTGRKITDKQELNTKTNINKRNVKKKVKDMSNKELIGYTKRLTLESNFMSAYDRREKQKNARKPKPQQSKASKFVSRVASRVVIPALTDASKKALENKVYGMIKELSEDNKKTTYVPKSTYKPNNKKTTNYNKNKTKKK